MKELETNKDVSCEKSIFFKCDPICYFQNPYLVSKLLEVLYVINPTILDSAEALHARFMSHPISEEYLPSALMKFYTGKPKPFY